MYPLDNVKIVSTTHFDTSDIPDHIKKLFSRYMEVPYSEWSDLTTPAQKRTRTMRFNKFYDACNAAGVNPASATFRLINE
jgi:hypothetical protein